MTEKQDMPTSHNEDTVYKQGNTLDLVGLTKKAIRLFPRTAYVERPQVNHLRRAWISAVSYLGPRWILHRNNSPQPQFLRRQGVI